jgi:hypothetical protein
LGGLIQKLCDCIKSGYRVWEIRAIFYSEAQESAGALTKKKKGKNMSATDTKEATSAMLETIDEVCQEGMSCYEKREKEFVETFNRVSNQTIDLFEKTLGIYEATSVPDTQRRVQDLIESSLSALRVNVHSTLNMNLKSSLRGRNCRGSFRPVK